ncbi:hypothetical protein M5M_13597 [Simiduia agarivorans SA1 = DSM 21679]|uniref:Uncharacterized protein n=1 Tax=Simiduia agarivorans (strain DSM 21679 / JCM 13881 / BCRC 17597 / SA1) TaxID=1117647 RepID=R9S689_SIMAS|nr:hypothetical protein M5M_13597 [Simiduia agarivorans SA1 = DSM 21679]
MRSFSAIKIFFSPGNGSFVSLIVFVWEKGLWGNKSYLLIRGNTLLEK